MGKAATASPPANPATPASPDKAADPHADDLLSKMADQEIERLLSEAQVERNAPDAKAAPAWNLPPDASRGKPASASTETSHVAETLASVAASGSPADHDAALAARIDSVFDEIVGEAPLSAKEKRQRAEAKLKQATAWASAPMKRTPREDVDVPGEKERAAAKPSANAQFPDENSDPVKKEPSSAEAGGTADGVAVVKKAADAESSDTINDAAQPTEAASEGETGSVERKPHAAARVSSADIIPTIAGLPVVDESLPIEQQFPDIAEESEPDNTAAAPVRFDAAEGGPKDLLAALDALDDFKDLDGPDANAPSDLADDAAPSATATACLADVAEAETTLTDAPAATAQDDTASSDQPAAVVVDKTQTPEPAPAAAPKAAKSATPAEEALSPQLDALFAAIQESDPTAELLPKTEEAAPPTPEGGVTVAATATATELEIDETIASAERHLLSEELPPAAPDPAPATPGAAPAVAASATPAPASVPATATEPAPAARPAGKRQPVLIRALELLNAPFNFVSDAARELMGKVAILTLVNALLILVYVVFIRKT